METRLAGPRVGAFWRPSDPALISLPWPAWLLALHYDPWWNPAVENQATDRAHRIGQTKPVFVYKLIAADTVEERIIELQDKKGRLAAATLDAGAAVGSLAAEDLDYLFGE